MSYSSTQAVALGATFGALPIPFVALRFYSQGRTPGGFRIDDWFIVPALILVVGIGVAVIIGAVLGDVGSHQTVQIGLDGQPIIHDRLRISEQVHFAVHLASIPALALTKLSALLLYHRTFPSRTFRTIVDVLLVLVAAWLAAFTALAVLRCNPIDSLWTVPAATLPTRCLPNVPLDWSLGLSDVITTLFILLLPLPMLRARQIPRSQRLALGVTYVLGLLVLGASVARLVVRRLVHHILPEHYQDVTYITTPLLYTALLPPSLALCTTALLPLRPLLLPHLPSTASLPSRCSPSLSYSSDDPSPHSPVTRRSLTRRPRPRYRRHDPELGALTPSPHPSARVPLGTTTTISAPSSARGGLAGWFCRDTESDDAVPKRGRRGFLSGGRGGTIVVRLEVRHERDGEESEGGWKSPGSDASSEKALEVI